MPTPEFIVELRRQIGTAPLWLSGASVLIFREGANGLEVLLGRRADLRQWWDIAGIVEPGEHPADTAVREALEEAGVQIRIERLLWVVVGDPVTFPNGDQCQFLDHGFRAWWVGGEARVTDDESLEIAWFPVEALPEPMRPHLAKRVAYAVANPPGVAFSL